MQTILKKTIKEKIILDREHQKIVTELDGTIDRLEKELHEIKNINKNDVQLDLNHPLAGIEIKFKVKIIEVYE